LRRRKLGFKPPEPEERADGSAKLVVRVAQLLIVAGSLYILYIVF
jgi:hypothetical protein